MGFSAEYCQTFKEDLIPIFFQLFPKKKLKEKLPNRFYETTITPIPKPHKDPRKKKNFRPIFFMSIDAKILNKVLTNQIQEHIKTIIHHDQVGFIPGMRGWFSIQIFINIIHYKQTQKQKLNDHLIRC